jgi:hypothetical protein
VKKDQGARYAIEVDGIVRTHRDVLTIALDAAAILREKNTLVRVVDTHTGQTVTQDPSNGIISLRTFLFGIAHTSRIGLPAGRASGCSSGMECTVL